MRTRISVRQIGKLRVDGIKLDGQTLSKIGKAIEGGILENILSQKQASGAPLKRNQPETRKRKRKMGWTVGGLALSLIAEMRRFVKGGQRSWLSVVDVPNQTIVVKPATPELVALVRYVQRPKYGYTGWFGISKKTVMAIRLVLRNFLKQAFSRGR